MAEVSYVPGLLSNELGWRWRKISAGDVLHLVPQRYHNWSRAACGRKLDGLPEPISLQLVEQRYCRVCTHRNGGVSA